MLRNARAARETSARLASGISRPGCRGRPGVHASHHPARRWVCYLDLGMEPEIVGQGIVRRALTLCDTRASVLYTVDPRSGRLALLARAGEDREPPIWSQIA